MCVHACVSIVYFVCVSASQILMKACGWCQCPVLWMNEARPPWTQLALPLCGPSPPGLCTPPGRTGRPIEGLTRAFLFVGKGSVQLGGGGTHTLITSVGIQPY